MRRFMTAVVAAALTVAFAALAFADNNEDDLFANERRILENAQKTSSGSKGGSAWNMAVVGQSDLGGRGFNGDVWVHKGFAYIGHWGFQDWAAGNDRFCPEEPSSGVAVVDARTPSAPVRASTLQNPALTSAEDVVVYTAKYGPYAGRDIAVAGIQTCESRYTPDADRGLMFWDVTNPYAPAFLGRYDSGCCTRGVHEFEIEQRRDTRRVYAYVTVPFSERPDSLSPSGARDQQGRGEARIVDITDATAPVEVSTWGVKNALGLDPLAGQGCFVTSFAHGVTPHEKMLFISYWDAGYVALDIADPAHPGFLGRWSYPANADGDAHSASYDARRKLLFTADEDFCKGGNGVEPGWGYLRVLDFSNPAAPTQIGAFKTKNSLGPSDIAAGDYVIHNPFVVGTDVYISWYSDGVRVVDASDPRRPREVAYFVPPAGQNPVKPSQRSVLTNTTQVWGVVVDEATGLVYASDMNTGLWILRRTN